MSTSANDRALATSAGTLHFRNPIVLAAGTAAYGRELADVVAFRALGGIVTKAVSTHPRAGAPAPRVAEFDGGMINAIGLANPGVDAVRADHLPWLASAIPGTRVIVNVVGFAAEDFAEVVAGLEDSPGIDAFELNVSCPNVKAGGLEFGADPVALRLLVTRARAATARPIFVKLSAAFPDLVGSAVAAVDAGADALSLVNTLPGLVIDVERRQPVLGFGSGGVSGASILPIGVLATHRVHRALPNTPLLGVGGVATTTDAIQYVLAGASLVGVGTAAMQDPRVPERLVDGLSRWCSDHRVGSMTELIGALEYPA